MNTIKVNLYINMFREQEKMLLEFGHINASTFIFPSGVRGLRIRNSNGELIMLPFQGQQIWKANFCGHDLSMKSSYNQPLPTTDFMKTYGGFLLHCGVTAMGSPSSSDRHPLHGELPNMDYEHAYVGCGEDSHGRFVTVGGQADYNIGFTVHYMVEPEIRLYENDTVIHVNMKITNLRSQSMQYMYLCHINFRPIDGSRLVYSAFPDKKHIKVHANIPEQMSTLEKQALKDYMTRIEEHPEIHNLVDPTTQVYDPEIVMTIKYEADKAGYAHSMQVMPQGDAYYVAHRVKELPVSLRWIARTGDEDALGLVLPATAEHKGLAYARKHGAMMNLDAGQSITMSIIAGYLPKDGASTVASIISDIVPIK
jgi:hypothetical protein